MKHKGDKDKTPRKRRSDNAVIIEESLKKRVADTPVVAEYQTYLNFRINFLKRIQDGKPYRYKEQIGSNLVQMVKEGVILRFGYYFQITDQGRRAIKNA